MDKAVVEFLDAAAAGQLDKVNSVLERYIGSSRKRVNINATGIRGWTALMLASYNGHMDVVVALCDRGADVNASHDDATVLTLATLGGYVDIVKVLCDRGAAVNAVDNGGFTALMYASKKGRADIVTVLCDQGADVNAVNKNGKTAVMLANNFPEVTRILFNYGAPAPPLFKPVPAYRAAPNSAPSEVPKGRSHGLRTGRNMSAVNAVGAVNAVNAVNLSDNTNVLLPGATGFEGGGRKSRRSRRKIKKLYKKSRKSRR